MAGTLKPPILLIGNVRSGTSMMHDLFDAHPEAVGWSEPRTLWMCADPGRTHDRFDETDARPHVKRYIRRQFLRYQKRHGHLRVMEKTPSNVLRIPYLHAIFPESKLIYIYREPLANLSSTDLKWNNRPINLERTIQRLRETPVVQLPWYARRFLVDTFRGRVLRRPRVNIWGVRYPGIYEDLHQMTIEEVIAHQWVACVRTATDDIARLPDDVVLTLRYEDFVAQPIEHFARICDHVGLAMTDTFAAQVRAFVDPTRQRKWKRLAPDVLRRCLPIYQQAMSDLGYPLPDDVASMIEDEDSFPQPAPNAPK